MPDRSHFDDETLQALDDIARLLHIKTAVSEMKETLESAEGLDGRRSKPSARRVMKAVRAAAEDLLKEAFVRQANRSYPEVRRRHMPDLMMALESATLLSRQEHAAISGVVGKGVLHRHVVHPLQELTARWEAVAREKPSAAFRRSAIAESSHRC